MAQDTNNFLSNVVNINSVILKNFNGILNDITLSVQGIEIYESIYLNTITGCVKILDAADLPQEMPIIGEEYITIDINLPGGEQGKNFIFEDFRIYKMTDRVIRSDKIQSYTLWFISKEAIKNFETKVSKIWKQETSDKIVKDIFARLESDKNDTFEIESTMGVHTYIATNENPFNILNYLASNRSINSKKLSDYMFFENLDSENSTTKFNFVSLNSLYEQEPIQTFSYGVKLIKNNNIDVISLPYSVDEIKFSKNFDILESKIYGMYNQTYIYYDMLRKKYVVQKNTNEDIFKESGMYRADGQESNQLYASNAKNYSEYFKFVHVNTFPSSISNIKDINNKSNRGIENRSGRSTNTWINTYGTKDDKVSTMLEKTLYRRKALMEEFEVNKINLNDLSGNYKYTIGKTVTFNKPHIRLNKTEAEVKNDGPYDKYISGKYLITGTNHIIKISDSSNWEYKTSLEISKNSVKTAYNI